MRIVRKIAVFVFLLMAGIMPLSDAATNSGNREYALKAVFLYRCSQFVEWPENAFSDSGSPLVIGILGSDPFGNAIDATVKGEVVNGRKVVVQRYDGISDVKDCHILFICNSEEERVDEVLEGIRNQHILTIGDTAGFASRGGMVEIDIERNKLQAKVNLRSAKASGLTISSKLLRLAKIIEE
jgi:hypothetical protein